MIYFDECLVSVNGTGLLAESASVSENNNLLGAYILGRKGTLGKTPNGPQQAQISISYFLKTDQEPIHSLSEYLKNYTGNNLFSIPIIVGGLSGNGYLTNYSVETTPNEPIKANAQFICFTPIQNSFAANTQNINYTGTNISGIAHSWVINTISNEYESVSPTYSFGYNATFEVAPIYKLGTPFPVEIKLMGGQENFEFEKEIYTNIQFSGQSAKLGLFNNDPSSIITLNSIGLLCNNNTFIQLNTENSTITESSAGFQVDDMARNTVKIVKYF